MKHFYILFLIVVSVFIFFIAYTNGNNAIIEGKRGQRWTKNKNFNFKKLGNSIKTISKTVFKKLANNLNPMKLIDRINKRKLKRQNRKRNKRIQKYIRKMNIIWNYTRPVNSFVSSAPIDYIELLLIDFYNFYIVNHSAVYEIWGKVRPQTRTYLKEKYKRFLEIKKKILDFLNTNVNVNEIKVLTLSTRTFELPEAPIPEPESQQAPQTVYSSSSLQSSDFSKEIFNEVKTAIDAIRQTNTEPEAFTDFFGNSDNGQYKKNIKKISVPYYVNLYDEYADSAYFKSYDKIEILLQSYETTFNKNVDIIKYVIDGINQAPSVENKVTIQKGQTLHYLNTKLEYFYTIINTIEQKTAYGQQLIS